MPPLPDCPIYEGPEFSPAVQRYLSRFLEDNPAGFFHEVSMCLRASGHQHAALILITMHLCARNGRMRSLWGCVREWVQRTAR